MSYTVLARRYRSQGFDDVIGQDATTQTLKNAIKCGRVAHAYLFTGTRGVGKTTMARILAKALNCLKSDEPTVKPCCKCDSCVSVNAGEDIDVIEIDGASNTGVDNIRELRQNAIYRPARARYKIYIIDEVHMLSTAAFNALLKILEEPPDHVKFIFATTEPNKVLATVQSRCQRFDFNSISPAAIGKQLKCILKAEKIKYEDDLVLALARLANGSMRDGLSLLDQLISAGAEPLTLELLEEFLGEPNREKICELIDRIGDKDAGQVLGAVDSLLTSGQTCSRIVDSLVEYMRDLIVTKSTSAKSELLILTAQERERMTLLADKFDTPALIYNVTALEKLRWTIKNSDNPRALLEASILRLALSEHFIGVPQLLSWLNMAGGGVKKKRPAGDKNASKPLIRDSTGQSPAPQSTTEPQVAPVNIVATSSESIKADWQAIIAAVRGKDAGAARVLEKAEPAGWSGNVLTLGFGRSAGFAMSMCRKQSGKIAGLLSDALGTDISIRFETVDDKPDEQRTRPEGASPSRQEKAQALDDPAVKEVLKGLDATVAQIDEIDRE